MALDRPPPDPSFAHLILKHTHRPVFCIEFGSVLVRVNRNYLES